MNRAARIGLIILSILLVIVIVAGVAVAVVVRRPFPTTDGTLTVTGLQAPVDVYRDDYGIPHIYADK